MSVSGSVPGLESSDVAEYYDRNTRRFLFMGRGTPSFHRALWAPGVVTPQGALQYVDAVIASEIERLGVGDSPVVVDFGCGVGGTLFYLAHRFPRARLVGVTVSERQVELARRLARGRGLDTNCTFVLGDFHAVDLQLRADLVVAVEAFVHTSTPDAFFANVARHLDVGGRLIVIDDFLAADEAALSPEQRARVDQLRTGWRIPAICTLDRFTHAAATAGFDVDHHSDLTPLTRPGSRIRDRLTEALSPVLARLGLARIPFYGNMIGGNALQAGLRGGFLRYASVMLRKRR